jgi:hypothetical protein
MQPWHTSQRMPAPHNEPVTLSMCSRACVQPEGMNVRMDMVPAQVLDATSACHLSRTSSQSRQVTLKRVCLTCRMSCPAGRWCLRRCGAPSQATARESGWASTQHTRRGEVRNVAAVTATKWELYHRQGTATVQQRAGRGGDAVCSVHFWAGAYAGVHSSVVPGRR